MLPGPVTDHPAVRWMGRWHYERMLRNGVRIFEYQPRFLHAKVLLCDARVSIGSTNADRWNYHWNLEANQEVDDPVIAEQVVITSYSIHYTKLYEMLQRVMRQSAVFMGTSLE